MGSWNVGLPWILLLSALMFVGSIVAAGLLIVRMPADYLTRDRPPEPDAMSRRPLIRGVLWFFKNAVGLLLLISGVIMLLTPGQGVLCIFLGVTMLDFPGKQRLLRRLLGRHGVLEMINRVRDKAKQPPLEYRRPSE